MLLPPPAAHGRLSALLLSSTEHVFVKACNGFIVCQTQAAFGTLSIVNLAFIGGMLAVCAVITAAIHRSHAQARGMAVDAMSAHATRIATIFESERAPPDAASTFEELARRCDGIDKALETDRARALVRAWWWGPGLRLPRFMSWLHVPEKGLPGSKGRYSEAGKLRQASCDIEALFTRASLVHDTFQDHLEALVQALCAGEEVQLVRGPVKSAERAMQKIVRNYRRDVGCLSDLVRCTIVCQSPQQLLQVFSDICNSSEVDASSSAGSVGRPRLDARDREDPVRDEEAGLLSERGEGGVLFRMTACKNRFRDESPYLNPVTNFRNVHLNLQVGWVFEEGACTLVPVSSWAERDADTLICEVQLRLESFSFGLANSALALAKASASTDTPRSAASAKTAFQLGMHADYIRFRDLNAV